MSAPPFPAEVGSLSHRVVEVMLRSDDDGDEPGHRVRSTIARIHGRQRPIVSAWVRTRPSGPVVVLAGGGLVEDLPAATSPSTALSFPAGARGRRLTDGEGEGMLQELRWVPTDLTLDVDGVDEDSVADSLEDLVAMHTGPVGLLVVARPLTDKQIGATIESLSDDIARLESTRSGRGVHRRRLARSEQDLTYLDRSAAHGCWEIEIWVGGSSESEARGLAGALGGTRDLVRTPLVMKARGSDTPGRYDWSGTCAVGSDVVGAMVRPPFRELPGLRLTRMPDFDRNVEDDVELRLGNVLDETRSPGAPFGVSVDSVNRHVFVCGATGSGKSETVRSLLSTLSRRSVPWLVIEPAKAEYASLAPWLGPAGPLVVVRPGDPGVAPPMLNPLEPTSIDVGGVRHTFPLQTHLDLVKALFVASFEAQDPFPQVLSAGLTRTYESRGWDLVTGTAADASVSPPTWPGLSDLIRESLAVVDEIGYGAEARNNVRGFIRVRLDSLRAGTPGRFFEGGFPLDVADLLRRPAVFEIEDLGDDQDKAFFIGNLIIRIVELLRLQKKHGLRPPGLAHVLVIEEAHRLLRATPGVPVDHAVGLFADLLSEIRAYGEGVVVAEQIPSKVIPDVVKNSAVKIMHRLPARDDRDAVGATMNLGEAQSEHVVALRPGEAVAHAAGMDRPVLVRIDAIAGRKAPGGGVSSPRMGARSTPCAVLCADHPCTLGEITAARRLAGPAVGLWAELSVVAHLTWDSVGSPSGPWFERLQAADVLRARCGIAGAVAEAVERRMGLVRRWHDPAEFASAVTNRMTTQLATGRGFDRPPARWAVGRYRLATVQRQLLETGGSDDRDVPHPLTPKWRQILGIDLVGPTWADQLAQLDLRRRQLPHIDAAALVGSAPALDVFARALEVTDVDPARRLASALSMLGLEYRWLLKRVGLT